MANLTDARLLYTAWSTCFDPEAPPFHRLSAPIQEAWLYVAAIARMLDQSPEPAPLVIPGLLHMATWSARDRWADISAPKFPQVGFTLEGRGGFYILETERGNVPHLTHIPIPPTEVRKVPGLIYDETPIH